MAIPYLRDINLNQNELQNFVVQNLAVAPENPIAGQMYFNTVDKITYTFDGTQWITGTTYQFTGGLTLEDGTVTLDKATTVNVGGVIVGTNIDVNNGTISVKDATSAQKGVIQIATDAEFTVGTDTTKAVTTKQVTDAIADAVADKIELTDLTIAAGSTDYLTYDNTTGAFGANVDTTVTANSTNLVTSGAVKTAIDNALIGGVIYKGTWTIATTTTDYSGIALPVKKGYMYYVTGVGPATVGGIEWNVGDYLLVNEDVPAGGSLVGNVQKIDNTEASDIVRLDVAQTLTNKTINADNNTISNLELDNFKTGVVQTVVRATTSAVDTAVATELAIAKGLAVKTEKFSAQNTALTASGGVCTWTLANSIGSADVLVQVFRVADNTQVMAEVAVTAANVVIKMNSTTDIEANTYRAVVVGL